MNALHPKGGPGRTVSFVRSMTIAAILLLLLFEVVPAQHQRLTLGDILIGLRSKKVTLEERNSILAAAVRERGITFTVSEEIEKELRFSGAAQVLIDAVNERSSQPEKPAAPPTPQPTPTPVPTPTPPDYSFYKTRGDENLSRGDFRNAISDYDKAVSLKPDSAVAFLSRSKAFAGMNELPNAVADLDRSLAIEPKDAKAILERAGLNERLGQLEKAEADFLKVSEMDPADQTAASGLKRVRDAIKVLNAPKPAPPVETAKAEPLAKAPESVDLGVLTPADAVRMVVPAYSPIARKSGIKGRVSVTVQLDETGAVTEAKGTSGHQFLRSAAEDAARRSKFKPATVAGQPVKATATIIYNFDPGNRE
jgi:TonB family protein